MTALVLFDTLGMIEYHDGLINDGHTAMADATIFIVEDDQAVRDSLTWMLQRDGYQIEAYSSPAELLSKFDSTRPGCLVLDLRLPQMSGIELHEQLVASGCVYPFIMISGHGEVADATRAMRLGAFDFIEKPIDRKLLLERIKQAVEYDSRRRHVAAKQDAFQCRFNSLTAREREVLQMIIAGRLTKQIAYRLDVAVKTVESHRSNIGKKMKVDSVVDLVRICTEYQVYADSKSHLPIPTFLDRNPKCSFGSMN